MIQIHIMTDAMSMLAPMLLMQQRYTNFAEFLPSLIILVLTYVFANSTKYKEVLRRLMIRKKPSLATRSITAKITLNNNVLWFSEIPIEYRALMHSLYKECTITPNVVNFSTKQVYIGSLKFMNIIVFDDSNTSIAITPNIDVSHTITVENQNNSANGTFTYQTYRLNISSKNYTDIDEYIQTCVDDYTAEQLSQLKKLHIFILSEVTADTKMLAYQEVPFETTKSFDNLFFEGKDTLMTKLDDFAKNESKYKQLGIPYTFGMMFHGTPGCGKTSCIKAIAKYTNRHIISVPVHKVKTLSVLKKIFLSSEINGIKIPNNRRLYVFEEIDCGAWKNLVRSRKLKEANREDDGNDKTKNAAVVECVKLALAKQNSSSTDKNPVVNEDDELTLGDLLELLDGIVEMPGRMLIMTSNHPEQIDAALLRPGRIDKVIEFKKMTRNDVINMYKLWFSQHPPDFVVKKLKDYSFSQAEIGNLFANPSRKHIHNVLMSSS